MKEELGNIIKNVRTSKTKNKLFLIIGNGIDPIHEINIPQKIVRQEQRKENRKAKKEGRKPKKIGESAEEIHRICWKNFEYVRLFTSNALPIFAYFLIWYLGEEGIVDNILTTNYDQFFDSIYQKILSKRNLAINPILGKEEYDWQGYYSARQISNKAIKLYQVHGSLSHVIFLDCVKNLHPHIFRLPTFLMGFNTTDIRLKYPVKLLHFSLNYLNRIYKGLPSIMCSGDTGYYVHFVDTWFKDKKFFQREIDEALKSLINPKHIEAILSVGFTGSPKEELIEPIKRIVKDKKVPFFYAISQEQEKRILLKKDYLYHDIIHYSPDRFEVFSNGSDFLTDLLGKSGFDLNDLSAKYKADWVFSNNTFENRTIFPRGVV